MTEPILCFNVVTGLWAVFLLERSDDLTIFDPGEITAPSICLDFFLGLDYYCSNSFFSTGAVLIVFLSELASMLKFW